MHPTALLYVFSLQRSHRRPSTLGRHGHCPKGSHWGDRDPIGSQSHSK